VSVGEAIGLALTCLLIGMVIGAALTQAVSGASRWTHIERARLAKTVASWLAARRTLSSAILHNVATQRALNGRNLASPFLPGQQADARAATARWLQAARKFEYAEAKVAVVLGLSIPVDLQAAKAGLSVEVLRQAIEGDDDALSMLRENLRRIDFEAARWIQETLRRENGSVPWSIRLERIYSAVRSWRRSFGRRRP